MDDEAALRARIAALAGQIDERKQIYAHPHTHPAARGNHRWAPYGRGGRAGFHKPHKNRTLVIASTQNGTIASPGGDAAAQEHPTATSPADHALITTRGAKANQLMTKHVFEREQKQRQEYQETHQKTKRPKLDRGPSDDKHVAKPTTQHRELEIEGIRFQLKDDGSKLIRITGQSPSHGGVGDELNQIDTATAEKETPKKAKVADVEFLRTKNGNLIRVASQSGDHRYYHQRSTLVDIQDSPFPPHRITKRAPKAQCENFTKYGTLPRILYRAGHARATTCEHPPRAMHAGKQNPIDANMKHRYLHIRTIMQILAQPDQDRYLQRVHAQRVLPIRKDMRSVS